MFQCSVSCGEGIRQRSVSCRLASGQLSPGCNEENKPAFREACNIRPCPTWITGDWGKVMCHLIALEYLLSMFFIVCFVCLFWEGTIDSYWINWQTFGPVPHVMIFALSLLLWGIGRSFHFYLFCLQCSVTCDSGIKVRSVECSDKDFSCDARNKPQTTTQCNLKPCPRWKTSPWGEVNCYLHTNAKSR